MSDETKRVDVVAVMRRADDFYARIEGNDNNGLGGAIEAVAELIEAASEVTNAFRAIGNDKTIITPPGLVKRAEDAMVAMDKALSRIGGQS